MGLRRNPTTGKLEWFPDEEATTKTVEFGGNLYEITPGQEPRLLLEGNAQARPTNAETYIDPQGNLVGIDPVTGEERFVRPGAGRAAGGNGPAPTQAETYIDAQGTLVGLDPVTGAERFRIPGAGLAKLDPRQQAELELSGAMGLRQFDAGQNAQQAQQQRAFQQSQSAQDRLFQSSEGATQRAYGQQESATQRGFQANESALDRAQRVSQFAAQFGLEQQSAQRQDEMARFDRNRGLQQDRLAGANQFANVISTVDPAALPAFYAAGGGNIMNSLSSGATALSDNAIAPAALTLDSLNAMAAQQAQLAAMPRFQPATYTPPPAAISQFGPGQGEYKGGPLDAMGNHQANWSPPPGVGYAGMAPGAAQFAPAPMAPGPSAQAGGTGFRPNGVDENGNLRFIAAANGFNGTVTEPTLFMAGEAGQPEKVNVQPIAGATDVQGTWASPEQMTRSLMPAPMPAPQMMQSQPAPNPVIPPGVLPATAQNPNGVTVTPESAEAVKRIRMGVDTSDPLGLGTMNTQFSFLPPSLVQRIFAARQSKFGIPVQDQMAEQQRYQLGGMNRGSLGFGI